MLNINFQIPDDKIARIAAAFKVSTVVEFKEILRQYVLTKVEIYEQKEAKKTIQKDNNLLS